MKKEEKPGEEDSKMGSGKAWSVRDRNKIKISGGNKVRRNV